MSHTELPVPNTQKSGALIICLHAGIRREFQDYLSALLSAPVWPFSDRFCMFLFSSILRALPDSRIQYIVKQVCHQIACNDQNCSKNNRAL